MRSSSLSFPRSFYSLVARSTLPTTLLLLLFCAIVVLPRTNATRILKKVEDDEKGFLSSNRIGSPLPRGDVDDIFFSSDDGSDERRRRQLLEEEGEEEEEEEEEDDSGEVDESAVLDAIEEADASHNDEGHPTDFEATDHTDLYTAKRDRDRAWEKARKGSGFLDEAQGHRVKIVTRRASERRKASSGNNYEHGTWVQIGQNHAFVSKHSEAFKNPDSGLYTTTVSDDNLRAALGLGKDTSDAEMLQQSTNERRWGRNSDKSYRDKVCSGTRHDMPRWCKGPAGRGGNVASKLDDAEQYWREMAQKRQEAKMTLLTAHQAFLKEDAIQKEAMVYTKKALEAQEKVDAAARLAQQREQAEADTLKEHEMSEQQAWHRLSSLRHQVVKYRTMTREQVEEMEREQRALERRMGQEERLRASGERSRVSGDAARVTDEVDKAKQRLRRAGENLKSSVDAHKKLERSRLNQAAANDDDDDDNTEDEEADDNDGGGHEEVK